MVTMIAKCHRIEPSYCPISLMSTLRKNTSPQVLWNSACFAKALQNMMQSAFPEIGLVTAMPTGTKQDTTSNRKLSNAQTIELFSQCQAIPIAPLVSHSTTRLFLKIPGREGWCGQ
eukprot:6450784-Amphidinium_carterae.1